MKKKIIVIDDDKEQKELYHDVFTAKGYEVHTADDGLEGLELALKENPDLVFTGIIMPRMDGFELIHSLRSYAATAQVPVILFSHLGREEDKKKAEGLENVTFMLKGFDTPNKIAAKVAELVGE